MEMKGYFRQDVLPNTRVGNFLILERDEKKHRPHHNGGDWQYIGKCIFCGNLVSKTMWKFKNHPSHNDCKKSKPKD